MASDPHPQLPRSRFFRAAAVQQYIQRQEESVLPQLIRPRTFQWLWAILGMLGVCLGGLAFAPIPVYSVGPATVLPQASAGGAASPDTVVLVVFLPPDARSHLVAGQRVVLQTKSSDAQVIGQILRWEPDVLSPGTAAQRFALPPAAEQALTQPMAVAIARFDPPLPALPLTSYIGSLYSVSVETGSRRMLSFFPFIGALFPG